jgi:molecular chaperone DnaK (HSP70)
VTVPYYFKAHQCRNARKAAELAGIECTGIIQEPIAASLMYTWQRMEESPDWQGEEVILVFDLGGGTFDLTLFRLGQRRKKITFEVLGTGGDDFLGGMDFDKCLEDLILEKSGLSLEGLDPLEVRKARQKLNDQAIEAKKTLSAVDRTYVTVPFVVGAESIDTEVTRTEFERAIASYLDKIREIIDKLWMTSGMAPSRVDRALLVGGSSKIPCMKRILSGLFGEHKVYSDINQSECVATGAALYAAHLDDPNVLGREIEIQTVTSHALGVETGHGEFTPVIPANRKTPCEAKRLFTTDRDNMTCLAVNVYQGSSALVKANSLIGTVKIGELTPLPRGKLNIEVTFRVGTDQTLSVTVDVDGKRRQAAFAYA